MRILAAMISGFAGLLLGLFCGGVIVMVMIGAAGDDVPPPLLIAVAVVPTLLFAVLGTVFGFMVSGGADEFGLRPPVEADGPSPFPDAHEPEDALTASVTGHLQSGHVQTGVEETSRPPETFLSKEPAKQPQADDGIFVAELVDEHPIPPPVHPSRLARPMYPPRPPVNATPARPPRKWPGGWSMAGIVLGVLAIAPAAMAAIVVGRTTVGALSLAVFSALFFLPGLLCMATALWGDFTRAKVLRAGKVGVVIGLIFNACAFLAVAFSGVVALHSDVLPPSAKTRKAQAKLIAAREKRIEQARELRIAARPFVSPRPKPFVPTPRPGSRPGTTPPAEPRTTAVRIPLGALKASPAFTEKKNEGRSNVLSGATFTPLDLVRSAVTVPPVWSQSGKQFYTAEKDGYVRRISSEDLLQTHEIKLDGEINSMTLTRKGLVIARSRPGDVLLLEPTSLRPLKRYMLPGVKGATGGALSDTVYLWFNGARDQPPGGYLLNLETQDAFPQRKQVMGTWFAMTPSGNFLLTADSSQLRRYGVGREELKLHQTSQRIGSNPRNIDVSPGGKYVALPSGGGNRMPSPGRRRMSYGTFIFSADNLAESVTSLVSGPYPRTVSYDPRSEVFYTQASGVPLMVFSPEGSLLRRYTTAGVPMETDRIITSPPGGQLLLMGSMKLIHVTVPPPKLPGTDVFGSRVAPPTRLDLAAPVLPRIVTASFEGASKTVMLPAAVGSVTPAGGGRYYLIYLPEVGQIAVFDVSTASIIRYLQVSPATDDAPAEELLIAGASEFFVTLDPKSLTASRWSLRTFKLEKVETLSSLSQPISMCMGAASRGPLLIATRSGHHFFDPQTLLNVKIKSTVTLPSGAAGTRVRASADGRVFTSNAAHLRQRAALTRLEVSPEFVNSRRLNPYTSIPLPGYDGANIYSTAGDFSQSDIYRRSASATRYSAPFRMVMPSVRGALALQFQLPEQTRLLPEAGSAPHLAARVQLVALRSGGRELLEIGDLEAGRQVLLAYNTRDLAPERLVLPFDQRFFISSPAEVYGYIPLTRDRIEVHKLDAKSLAAKKRGRFMFFTSEPPAAVKAGTRLTYHTKIHSSSDEIRYQLLPARPGMTIDNNGKLTWQVPATAGPVDMRFTIMAKGTGVVATQMVRVRIEP